MGAPLCSTIATRIPSVGGLGGVIIFKFRVFSS